MNKLDVYYLKILRRIGLLDKLNLVCKSKYNNFKLKIPVQNRIGLPNMMLKSGWLDALIDLYVINDNKTFVDVGVNIGQTMLRLRTKSLDIKYIGFEPNATCVSYSQNLLRLNSFVNCNIQNVALSNKLDVLFLQKTFVDDSRASLISELRPEYFTDVESVLAIDYDSLYKDEKIGFVKIDVEGAELEVLLGMKESLLLHKPIITCEVLDSHNEAVLGFTQNRVNQLCEFLQSIDYSIIQFESTDSYKINSFKVLSNIEIKQWTPNSYALNDYLFYPKIKEEYIMQTLITICINK